MGEIWGEIPDPFAPGADLLQGSLLESPDLLSCAFSVQYWLLGSLAKDIPQMSSQRSSLRIRALPTNFHWSKPDPQAAAGEEQGKGGRPLPEKSLPCGRDLKRLQRLIYCADRASQRRGQAGQHFADRRSGRRRPSSTCHGCAVADVRQPPPPSAPALRGGDGGHEGMPAAAVALAIRAAS